MNKTTAIKMANEAVNLYREGKYWICSTIYPGQNMRRLSSSLNYYQAVKYKSENKLAITLDLMGYNLEFISSTLDKMDYHGGNWKSYIPAKTF